MELLIKKKLASSNIEKEEFTALLMSHFKDDWQKEQLYKVLTETPLQSEYSVGNSYWISYYNLNSWNFDKDLMEEAGLLIDEKILVKVVSFNIYDEASHEVQYTCISKGGERNDKSLYKIKPSQFGKKHEDFPF